MRFSSAALLSALALTITAPVAAQTMGFYHDGYVALDYLNRNGIDRSSGIADLSFGVLPGHIGSAGAMGYNAGAFFYRDTAGNDYATGFAALTFALGGGVLHLGAPRGATHGVVTLPSPLGARSLNLGYGLWTGVMPYSTFVPANAGRLPLGLMYEHDFAPMRYAVSYVQVNDGGTVHIAGLATERQFDNSRVYGTLEHIWGLPGSGTLAVLGGSMILAGSSSSLREIELGGAVSYSQGFGLGAQSTATVFGRTWLTQRLALTLVAMYLTASGGNTLFGLNGAYDLWNGIVLNAGVGRETGWGGSTVWTAGLSRGF